MLLLGVASFTQDMLVEAVPNPFNIENNDWNAEWPVTVVDSGPRLLLSDSPEYVDKPGVLYRDTLQGDSRIFFYHVNHSSQIMKAIIRLDNMEQRAVKVKIASKGLSWPDFDTVLVGKAAEHHWLTDKGDYVELSIAKDSYVLLDNRLNNIMVFNGQLINGIYDFSCNGKVLATIAFLPYYQTIDSFWSNSPTVLMPDNIHPAGTFEKANRSVEMKSFNGAIEKSVAITLADGKNDKFLVGYDARTQKRAINQGNYGVKYTFRGNIHGQEKYIVDVYLAALGGVFGGWLGLRETGEYRWLPVPDSWYVNARDSAIGKQYPVVFLTSFTSIDRDWLIFSPPGGSALPVRLVLEPVLRSD